MSNPGYRYWIVCHSVCRAWSMGRRQDCPDEFATHLRRSPVVLISAEIVGGGHLGAFPEHPAFSGLGGRYRRSAQGKERRVIVAGVLRTHRDNPRGDPSNMRAKPPPNSRDGARCDAAFQNFVASGLILEFGRISTSLSPSASFRCGSTFDTRHSLNRVPLANSVTQQKNEI